MNSLTCLLAQRALTANFRPNTRSDRTLGGTIRAVTIFEAIEIVGKIIDVIGVGVIAVGALIAAVRVIPQLKRKTGAAYRKFHEELGRSILLGLEFLVAADIIRTVAITPDAKSVAVLGGIVVIRTVLSFALQVEITGRWPWQSSKGQPGREQAG